MKENLTKKDLRRRTAVFNIKVKLNGKCTDHELFIVRYSFIKKKIAFFAGERASRRGCAQG